MTAKLSKAAAPLRMSDSHVVALGKIVGSNKFTLAKDTGIHAATRQALVTRGFAVLDASGDKIKVTASGRKAHAKATKQQQNE